MLVAVALFGGTAALDIEEDYYKLLNVQQDATNPQVSPLISRTPAQKHLSSIVLFRTICFFSFFFLSPFPFSLLALAFGHGYFFLRRSAPLRCVLDPVLLRAT